MTSPLSLFPGSTEPAPDGRTGTVIVFLSLFMVVLAFFIVLVSISTVEQTKSKAVLKSITATFTPVDPLDKPRTDFTAKEGDVLGGQAFQEEITGLFATAVQVARVDVVKPGRLMRVAMPAQALFRAESAEMHETALPFLDRMATALAGRPQGVRYDMELVLGTADKARLPVERTLDMARAGVFARALVARGAPPDAVGVGVEPGEPGALTIRFYVRRQDDLYRGARPQTGVPR